MLLGAEGTAEILANCFSLELWGGATFDVAYRFLHESPWERLELLRERIPNIPFQMLLRGSNLVGYANYPDNLVRAFVKSAADTGIDIFRVFDSLNWIPGMEIAMDEVLKQNKFLEAAMCYTGDISDPSRDKYTLDYYVKLAKELERRGAHSICIKDMSGLLKPYAAKKLITTLKQEVGLPIHLHTHDTTGNQVATLLMAAEAGVDIVDGAISSMSSLTSQPSLNAVAAALVGNERDTGLDVRRLEELSDYWDDVRLRYETFDVGLKTPTTEIYRYEIPGGQYTNLRPQVISLGLGSRFEEVKEMYKTVNDMLGDLVKVTPSSKVVGDLAIFMVQNDLTPENIVEKGKNLAFPDSVVSYFKGMMGQPAWGFPEDIQKVVLKGEKPITCRPGELLPPVDFDALREKISKFSPNPDMRSLISYAMYPKVYEDYLKHRKDYGYIMRMGSHVFFNGMALGETNKISIEEGKTLVIKYLGLGDSYEDGTREVRFELNGSRREIRVPDPHTTSMAVQVQMADSTDKSQIGSSIPGMVSKVMVKVGDTVKENQVVAVVEAMKMETSVVAGMDGVVKEVLVTPGKTVKAGELLIRIG
jgi:pyruvate carboxylase